VHSNGSDITGDRDKLLPEAFVLQATYFGFFVKYFYWTDALELDHLFMEVPYTPADGKE
jgi:hypothetical protein